ncbi:MAG: 9-O-acetylesterase [Candidatus Hydrogenedentes bacterium]|nr:9-O-acetylesterase [Candidatus Hydrogenedentota bacterium]
MLRMVCAVFVAGALMTSGALADVSLAGVFGDSMVLQRGKPIPVWGKAAPDEAITVSMNGKTAKTKADAQGAWSVKLPSMKAGGPYELCVTGAGKPVTLKDVLIGDVWVCSGQSNMGMTMQGTGRGILNGEKEIAAANYPNIRLFSVMPETAVTPQDELAKHSPWAPCTPQSVLGFSAAGYFFGRHVHQKENVPVGLVMTAWGGTYAEAWTSKAGLSTIPGFEKRLEYAAENLPKLDQIEGEYRAQMHAWDAQLDALDAGFQSGVPVWSQPQCPTADWKPITMPLPYSMLEDSSPSKLEGRIWLRRDIEAPASWQGRDLTLNLGFAHETDQVWFNGTEVGRFDFVYHFWDGQTVTIPSRLVKAGVNTVVIRLTDTGNKGGLFGEPGMLQLTASPPDVEPKSVSVAGPWLMKQGLPLDKVTPRPAPPAYWPNNPNMPTVLYNAMIHPLVRMPIKGVIWYQGESNADAAYEYRTLLPTLIQDWRKAWGEGNFPFLYVQIANFSGWQPPATKPRESTWAELREAQLMTLSTPKTGMAVTIDIGEVDDIHPINKKDVGVRLGLAAQHVAYGEKLEYSGPLYKSMKVKDGRARIAFTHAGGLNVKGGELKGFAIAGSDHTFVYAKAEVKGNEVVVWNDAVKAPVAVRYGWDFAPECNLYNAAGLPASPFRTDQWPGVTAPKAAAK